jgi:hypothetical protein
MRGVVVNGFALSIGGYFVLSSTSLAKLFKVLGKGMVTYLI